MPFACCVVIELRAVSMVGSTNDRPHNLLHYIDCFGWKEGRRVVVWYILHMRSVGWFFPGVWGVLWAFGRRMLKFVQGCLEIFWHGFVAGACGIVPFNGESAEEGTAPVDEYGVEFLEVLDEVVGVLFAYVLDPKVSNDEGENDWLGGVLPERRGSGNRGEAKMGEVSFESFVGNAAGLFEAGHAFLDL